MYTERWNHLYLLCVGSLLLVSDITRLVAEPQSRRTSIYSSSCAFFVSINMFNPNFLIMVNAKSRCDVFSKSLLDKYFGSLVNEAAVLKQDTIDAKYMEDLPLKIEEEYKVFLSSLWEEIKGNDCRNIDDILDKHYTRMCIDDKYSSKISVAKEDAERITLWERITNSNHKDVTYFKGLLYDYSCELLRNMTRDFLEDITNP